MSDKITNKERAVKLLSGIDYMIVGTILDTEEACVDLTKRALDDAEQRGLEKAAEIVEHRTGNYEDWEEIRDVLCKFIALTVRREGKREIR